jgi:hypothetical protein
MQVEYIRAVLDECLPQDKVEAAIKKHDQWRIKHEGDK